MPHRPARIPAYGLHKPTGQARVRLDGHDHYLGAHGSPESRAKYDRLIAEWLAAGRGIPATATGEGPVAAPADLTIDEVIAAYWAHAQEHYRSPDGTTGRELDNVRDVLRPLRRLYGPTPARAFGPNALRALRAELVRSGLARTTVNARVDRVRRVFRWAASVELIPASIPQALGTVAGLRAGRCDAREAPPVLPVPIEHVERTLTHLPPVVAAMVEVQLHSGCRPGEVMSMRGGELATSGDVWLYRPTHHKGRWRGRDRVIVLGPKAVTVVRRHLKHDPDAYLFSPHDSGDDRARSARYSRRTYLQAVHRACDKADTPRWSPLQLRHTAATQIRARFDIEAAEAVLGHSRPDVTVRYAERDLERARAVMREIG